MLGTLGLLLFGVSLAMPAVKHGEDIAGIVCFAMSILFLGSDTSHGGTAAEMAWICRISLIANLGSVCAFALGVKCKTRLRFVALPLFICVAFAVFYLFAFPYSQLENIHAGYYLWLTSVLIIAAAGDWGAADSL